MSSIKAETDYAAKVLGALSVTPSTVPAVQINEGKTRNAAACLTDFLCARLSETDTQPNSVGRTTFEWAQGIINVRNAVNDHLWTNLRPTFVEHFRDLAASKPSAYVLVNWKPNETICHVWAIPSAVVHDSVPRLPFGTLKQKRTLRIFPGKHVFERCEESPDLSPFYRSLTWSDVEREKLIEAVKIDEAARRRNRNDEDDDTLTEVEQDELGDSSSPGFTTATVAFLTELPEHITDAEWHEKNKDRYREVLQRPCQVLVEMLRDGYIERLSPEVAGGKRHLSILKKNDYGKGGYHDHYWFAFYDPSAGSKTKSVQLYFRMIGSEQVWRYGFAMGNYCEEYMKRLRSALLKNADAVADYIRKAPPDTSVRLWGDEAERRMTPNEFAELLVSHASEWLEGDGKLSDINLVREYPLDSLPEHESGLVEEVGEYFTWAWPFFEASMSGTWPKGTPAKPKDEVDAKAEEDVDEDAPKSIAELSELTSLSESLLDELEQSLLAKQQTVLVGPPGTSKTYIARQFARYFVRQRPGRPQGSHHVLYMHANWTYEDFFEGIKPTTTKEGTLTFHPQKGFFLEWVEQLKSFDTSARHVLVLDEINRCDTAAVLGELLQLLEYRGTTVRLLSGRRFVFPRNLFIIGTMNSAARSIGRMDLALRRRFLWLNLHAQPDALQRWLDRVGNNPIGFKSSALEQCNDVLAKRGIPPEQHIGHALFMVQESDTDDETGMALDIPLTEKHLRRIVQFSVLPYVRELFATQFGQVDEELIGVIRSNLLACLNEANPTSNNV
jgi:uncharacterized protein (DUF2461 family)